MGKPESNSAVMCRCGQVVAIDAEAGVTTGPMPRGCWGGEIGMRTPDVHAYCDKYYEADRICPKAVEEIRAESDAAKARLDLAKDEAERGPYEGPGPEEIEWLPASEREVGMQGLLRVSGGYPELGELRDYYRREEDGQEFLLLCKTDDDPGTWTPTSMIRVPVTKRKKKVKSNPMLEKEKDDPRGKCPKCQARLSYEMHERDQCDGCGVDLGHKELEFQDKWVPFPVDAVGYEGAVAIRQGDVETGFGPVADNMSFDCALLQQVSGDKVYCRAKLEGSYTDEPGWVKLEHVFVLRGEEAPAWESKKVEVPEEESKDLGEGLGAEVEVPEGSSSAPLPELPEGGGESISLIDSILREEEIGLALGKPDVGVLLGGLKGYSGGSSLDWGFNIHILIDWQQCKRRVFLAHVLGLKHRLPQQQFQIGTLVHASLQFAKSYGLDRWEDPLRFVENKAGAGVLGEELAIARACLRTRLSKFGHLDKSVEDGGRILAVECRLEAVCEEPVSITGLGRRRLRFVGRLDDVSRGARDVDGRAGVVVHDEKTASMLTLELYQAFGLDFQLTGYGALVRYGNYEKTDGWGPLAQTQVTIMVKPREEGGVQAIAPDDVVRVATDCKAADIERCWEHEMIPAATDLAQHLVLWGKEKEVKKRGLTVDNWFPKCTVNCVGRWGRCDFFEMCSMGLCGLTGMDHKFVQSDERVIDVLQRGGPYFEKPPAGYSAPSAKPVAEGLSSTRDVKEGGAAGIADQIIPYFKYQYECVESIGALEPDQLHDWVDDTDKHWLGQLFGDTPDGLDDKQIKKACDGLLKSLVDRVSRGSKDDPLLCAKEATGEICVSWLLPGDGKSPLAGESEPEPDRGPTKAKLLKGAKWYAIPRKMIVAEMIARLLAGTKEED